MHILCKSRTTFLVIDLSRDEAFVLVVGFYTDSTKYNYFARTTRINQGRAEYVAKQKFLSHTNFGLNGLYMKKNKKYLSSSTSKHTPPDLTYFNVVDIVEPCCSWSWFRGRVQGCQNKINEYMGVSKTTCYI